MTFSKFSLTFLDLREKNIDFHFQPRNVREFCESAFLFSKSKTENYRFSLKNVMQFVKINTTNYFFS